MPSAGRIFLFFFLILILCSCEDQFKTFEAQSITAANNKPGTADTVMTDSTGNFKFSRLRIPASSGLTASFKINGEHRKKALWMVCNGRVRSNFVHSNATITMAAVSPENEVVVWRAVFLKYYIVDVNRWCHFRDSLYLGPTANNKPYGTISVFAFLGGDSKGENFDMDTLHVELREMVN